MQKAVNVSQFNISNTFPRSERLRFSQEFSTVYAGKRLSGELFIVHFMQGESGLKCAFTVSKKVSKLAVKRNKLKRRLREIYRLNRSVLPAGTQLIIRAKPTAIGASFNEIQAEIIHLFTKITAKVNRDRIDKNL